MKSNIKSTFWHILTYYISSWHLFPDKVLPKGCCTACSAFEWVSPSTRTGLGWAKKVLKTASHVHDIPSAGRVGTAQHVNREETLQVSWPGKVADIMLGIVFFEPPQVLGETEEEGGHQHLEGAERGGNSSSWQYRRYHVSVYILEKECNF